MSAEEKELQILEAAFPAMSGEAFSAARARTLASGQSVLQAEGGIIYEVFPDGRRREVKKIAAPVAVKRGARFRIP